MNGEQRAANRWLVRLMKLSVAVSAISIVGWYAMQFRGTPLPKPKSPAQQVVILRNPSEMDMARRAAAEAITDADSPIVDELTEELSQGDAVGRALAAQVFGGLGVDEAGAVEALIAALADPEPEVRQQAADALRQIGARPTDVVAALVRQAQDANPEIRHWAVIELARIAEADGTVHRALRLRLSDSVGQVRAEALIALWRHSATSIDDLIVALHDSDVIVGSTACILLGGMGGEAESALPELAKLLTANDQSALSAEGALRSIAKQKPQILAPLLDYKDRRVARKAANHIFLSENTGEELHGPLLAHVDDPYVAEYAFPVLRRMGVEGRLRPPELLDALEQAGDGVVSLLFQDEGVLRERIHSMPFNYPDLQRGYEITDRDLARLAGLHNLRLLDLSANPIGDAGLEHIAELENLEWLFLYNTKITSAGLARLVKLTRLRTLALGGCEITDEGLENLRALPALEALDLRRTRVTDVGMQHLADMKQLKAIWLDETQVTDAGLAALIELPLLEDVGNTRNQFTLRGLAQVKSLVSLWPPPKFVVDDDLALLGNMPRLRKLILPQSGVTDAGLVHIAKLTQLESLELRQTAITDAGLAKLASLVNLKNLIVAETGATKHGLTALQEALPKLEWPLVGTRPQLPPDELDILKRAQEAVGAALQHQ